MIVNVKVNPLLAYQLKRKAINVGPVLGILLWLWSFSFVLLDTPLSGIYLSGGGGFGFMFRLVCMIAYPLIMLFPALCGLLAAQPSRYTSQSTHRELLALTHVSNDDIVWTKIITTLYPMRSALAVFLGIAPMSFIVASLIWAVVQSQFSFSDCVRAFTGSLYCGVSYLTEPLLNPGEILPVSLAILELAVGVTGVFLLVTTVGALLAIYQKNRVVAAAVSGVFALAASFFIMVLVAPDVTLKSLIDRSADLTTVLNTLLLALVPYALTLALVRVSSYLVRQTA